jgi:hypothetical protein
MLYELWGPIKTKKQLHRFVLDRVGRMVSSQDNVRVWGLVKQITAVELYGFFSIVYLR